MLGKPEGVGKNGQFWDTGNLGPQNKDKQNKKQDT